MLTLDAGSDVVPGAGELHAPVPFWGGWAVVGVGLLLLAVVVLAWAVRRRRPRPAPPEDTATRDAPAGSVEDRHRTAREALARIEEGFRTGTLSARDVGHRTAAVLRSLEVPADSPALTACLPFQFAPRPPDDPELLLRAARAAAEEGGP